MTHMSTLSAPDPPPFNRFVVARAPIGAVTYAEMGGDAARSSLR